MENTQESKEQIAQQRENQKHRHSHDTNQPEKQVNKKLAGPNRPST